MSRGQSEYHQNLRVGVTQIQDFVGNLHNGKCVSKNYINNRRPLLFECKYQHQWEATWSNIKKGKWCPYCKVLSGERITRLYFECIFQEKFPKVRPNWLMGTANYLMELDGLCLPLGIAFEHQGLQHFQINQFSNTLEKLEKRQADDALKVRLCQENSIKLIVIPQVPQLTKIKELKNLIIEKCRNLNIPIRQDIDSLEINYELEPISWEYLQRYQKIAENRGGKCLSEQYINSDTKMIFQCSVGHIWEAIPDNVSSKNSWCPECSYELKRKKKL
jgi:hypothetical protein